MEDKVEKLALHGGVPVRETPLPPRGHIGTEEKEAVIAYLDRVIASGTLGAYQGEEEEAYCAQFAAVPGRRGYADAVSSGSAADLRGAVGAGSWRRSARSLSGLLRTRVG